jgi:hypothetical protein
LGISNGINNMGSVRYSFEEPNSGTRYDMAKQFGQDGVKAYLYEKKYQKGDESLKESKQYQQNLLAKNLGYSNYREMGEALQSGKLHKNDVTRKFRELEQAGQVNPENFLVEAKDSLSDKISKMKKHGDPRSTFTTRNDIQRKLLQNEIASYALENGYADENEDPNTLLFLQAVDSGEIRDSRAAELMEEYEATFEELGYMGKDYSSFKQSRGVSFNTETDMDSLRDQVSRRLKQR